MNVVVKKIYRSKFIFLILKAIKWFKKAHDKIINEK